MSARPDRRDSPLRASLRVIGAVMLRDVRTRFFNHGLGFVVSIGFPLVHILILVGLWLALDRPAPYGDSAGLFFGAALAPFMAWMYTSRFVMLSLIMNRPLLAFPAVKIVDVVIGRAALELLGACATMLLLIAVALLAGLDPIPHDIVDAALAFGVALLMGMGFGLVAALLALAAPSWVLVFMLLQILLYLASGIAFAPTELPDWLWEPLSWLPTLQIVEWARVAFFEGYPDFVLHRGYATAWAFGSLAFGLALERAIRGQLLGG
jgi:capsular polysaccharide transport system permease protein